MANQNRQPTNSILSRIFTSAQAHLKVGAIAVIFGMTAYGFIHILFWVVNWIEKM